MKLQVHLPFSKKARTCLGLDIGNYNLKIVEVEKKETEVSILNAKIVDIRQAKNISEVIKDEFGQLRISAKKANISISGEDVVARYLSLPKMTGEELKKAMDFELEDHIPFKPDEVYTDYHVLGDEANSKNRMRVFLVATKKNLIDEKIKLLRQAGLEPEIITTDALALKNIFYFNYPDKNEANIALLNIGDKITNLLITREMVPYFVRDSRFGGEAITTLLQTKTQLDIKAVEEIKHNFQNVSKDLMQSIKATLGNLLNEIFVSLDFYENLTEQRIDEIYLSGGTAQLVGLKEFLTGYLNLPIFSLDTLKNFSFPSGVSKEKITEISAYLAVALGLALEES